MVSDQTSSLHVRWLGGWVAVGLLLGSHLGALHSGSHSALLSSGWSRVGDGCVLLLELDSIDVLLVLDFLLHVLISLKKLVVLGLSQLQSFVQVSLELLLEGIHLILLLLNEFGLRSDDLLLSFLHVLLSFLDFELLCLLLNLMCFGISIR